MYMVGLDISKRKAHAHVTDENGKLVDESSVVQRREELTAYFNRFPASRILLEASTSSEWIARHLESLGHNVVVADPRFRLMYAAGDKKIKTDKRDARALNVALRVNAFRPAHRKSDVARTLQIKIRLRDGLVKTRTRFINQVRAICEWEGIVLSACQSESFVDVAREEVLRDDLAVAIEPTLLEIAALQEAIDVADDQLDELAKADPVVARLDTVRGIGPVSAAAFRAAIDEVGRFESAGHMTSYLGLVPSQYSSGDKKNRMGRITKTGDALLRGYLVEAAHCVLSKKAPDTALKRWGLAVQARSGKKRAAVAVARKLARILFAMWRDGTDFDPERTNTLTKSAHDEAPEAEAAAT